RLGATPKTRRLLFRGNLEGEPEPERANRQNRSFGRRRSPEAVQRQRRSRKRTRNRDEINGRSLSLRDLKGRALQSTTRSGVGLAGPWLRSRSQMPPTSTYKKPARGLRQSKSGAGASKTGIYSVSRPFVFRTPLSRRNCGCAPLVGAALQ